MTRSSFILLALTACDPQLTSETPTSLPADVVLTGELPADFDVDAALDTLHPGEVLVVGGSGGELAALQRIDPERVGSFVLRGARCIDCPSTCPPLRRTLEFDLELTGGDTAQHVTQTLSSANFTPDGDVTFFPGSVGDVTTLTFPGTLDSCGAFSYYFDVALTGLNDDPATKYMFVTTSQHDGAIGGVAGADAICQTEADTALLAGTYKAWLADFTGNPFNDFVRHDGPYVLTDDTTVIATDWADLTDAVVDADIDLHADATVVPSPVFYWSTGTTNGAPGPLTCGQWTRNDSGVTGHVGIGNWGFLGLSPFSWSNGTNSPCTLPQRLLCVEQ